MSSSKNWQLEGKYQINHLHSTWFLINIHGLLLSICWFTPRLKLLYNLVSSFVCNAVWLSTCNLRIFAGFGLVVLGSPHHFQGPLLAEQVLASLCFFLVHRLHYLLEDMLLAIFRYFLCAVFLQDLAIPILISWLAILEEVFLVDFLNYLADGLIPFFILWFVVCLFGRWVDLVEIFIIWEVLLLNLVMIWSLLFFEVLAHRLSIGWLALGKRPWAVTLAGDAVIDSLLNLLNIYVEDVALISIGLEPLDDVLVELAVVAPRIWVGVLFAVAGHVILVQLQYLFVQFVVQLSRYNWVFLIQLVLQNEIPDEACSRRNLAFSSGNNEFKDIFVLLLVLFAELL